MHPNCTHTLARGGPDILSDTHTRHIQKKSSPPLPPPTNTHAPPKRQLLSASCRSVGSNTLHTPRHKPTHTHAHHNKDHTHTGTQAHTHRATHRWPQATASPQPGLPQNTPASRLRVQQPQPQNPAGVLMEALYPSSLAKALVGSSSRPVARLPRSAAATLAPAAARRCRRPLGGRRRHRGQHLTPLCCRSRRLLHRRSRNLRPRA